MLGRPSLDPGSRIWSFISKDVIIETPIRAPRRTRSKLWVRIVREECLDHVLVFRRRHLRRILGGYVLRYNAKRLHR